MKFLYSVYIITFLFYTELGFSQTEASAKEKTIYLVTEVEDKPLAFKNKKEILLHLKELAQQERQNGFLTAHFQKLEKLNDSTYITALTKNSAVEYLEINNHDTLPELIKDEFLTPKEGNLKIPINQLKPTLKKLNQKLSKAGYPFNSLKLENFKESKNKLTASLNVSGLKKRNIDSIAIKGYQKFPIGFLKHYAGVKVNSIYDNQNVLNQTQLINSLAFVTASKPAQVLFNPKKTTLYLYLQKENANNFDGFLGFSTDEETGSLVLDGYLNLNLINNFNLGEELRIAYKNDSETQQQFSINSKLPYLFKLPLGLEASLSIFTQKEEFSTTEQNLGVNYTFSPRIEAFVGYKKYESADLNEDENVVSTFTNFDSQFLQTELRYIHRQNKLLFPQKTSIVISNEIGTRSLENTNQYKVGLNAKHIFQLNNRNSLYLANNFQYFISSNFLSNELYRLGGILSIRGFEENSLRATLYNVLNTEYRYQLSNSIYVHSIVDIGFIENEFNKTRDRLTSFGVGLAMLSKAGLFKLNYANGRSNNIPFEFGNSKVHLSLTAFF